MKALMDLGATTSQQSKWSEPWAALRLDSKTGFHMGQQDCKDKKDFWIQFDLKKPSEISQVILKRRADNDKPQFQKESFSMSDRLIDMIKVEYKNGNEKWTQYKDGALIPTGQKPEDKAELERVMELEPFVANAIKITFPANHSHTKFDEGYIGGRIDLLAAEAKAESG
jgi:hypothetical protein